MRALLIVGLVVATIPSPVIACLWDSETLEQERQRFPETLELITGMFLRHSPEFYAWRLRDRISKRRRDPNDDRLLDDIAVSLDKLGRHKEAIELARQQMQRNPERYETLANLGTFLIHDGQWKEGLQLIEQAIEVNPNAHFGRERYQRFLVMYLIKLFPDGNVRFPLAKHDGGIKFPDFVAQQLAAQPLSDLEIPKLSKEQRIAATQGVLGMMRFSKHDHPILLEVLGQLLTETYQPNQDAKRLAARCYIALADSSNEESLRRKYMELGTRALQLQTTGQSTTIQLKIEEIAKTFRKEQEQANRWFDDLAEKEASWIASGEDVEANYRQEFREPPTSKPISNRRRGGLLLGMDWPTAKTIVGITLAAIVLVIAMFVIMVQKRPRIQPADSI